MPPLSEFCPWAGVAHSAGSIMPTLRTAIIAQRIGLQTRKTCCIAKSISPLYLSHTVTGEMTEIMLAIAVESNSLRGATTWQRPLPRVALAV
jgi:hypothetical protein